MIHKRSETRSLCASLAILFLLTLASWGMLLTRSVRAATPPIMTTFEVAPGTARLGEIVEVPVYVHNAENLWGWQVDMSWDYTVLAYVGETFGDFLALQPQGTIQLMFLDYVDLGYLMATETTIGGWDGVDGDGWLVTIEFEVLSLTTTTINIDTEFTFWMEDAVTIWGDDADEMIKENGDFNPPWPEDIHVDGRIDCMDLAYVAWDYGTFVVQTKDPTTESGAWTNPTYAYSSDDQYASTNTDGAEHIYNGFGFATTGWTSVSKVEVGIESHQASGGNDNVEVSVSNDGGTTWSSIASAEDIEPGETDAFIWIDMTAKFSWTPAMLTDANLRVRIVHDKDGGSAEIIYVDWITARATPDSVASSPYTDVNGDGAVDITDLSMVASKYGEYTGY